MSDLPDRWNALPIEQRKHLAPFLSESHIRHLKQARTIMVSNHKRALREVDEIIANLTRSIAKGASDED